jgi:hypothetical protein
VFDPTDSWFPDAMVAMIGKHSQLSDRRLLSARREARRNAHFYFVDNVGTRQSNEQWICHAGPDSNRDNCHQIIRAKVGLPQQHDRWRDCTYK